MPKTKITIKDINKLILSKISNLPNPEEKIKSTILELEEEIVEINKEAN